MHLGLPNNIFYILYTRMNHCEVHLIVTIREIHSKGLKGGNSTRYLLPFSSVACKHYTGCQFLSWTIACRNVSDAVANIRYFSPPRLHIFLMSLKVAGRISRYMCLIWFRIFWPLHKTIAPYAQKRLLT